MGQVRIAFQVMDSNRASKPGQTRNENGLAKRPTARRIPSAKRDEYSCRGKSTAESCAIMGNQWDQLRTDLREHFGLQRHEMKVLGHKDDGHPNGDNRQTGGYHSSGCY